MAKKKNSRKPSVKVDDLRARKNPKGGATDVFLKLGDIKGESQDAKHKDEIMALKKPGISTVEYTLIKLK